MRPLPGEDASTARSRRTSFADNDTTPSASRSQPPQMTYFLSDEKTLESSQSVPTISPLISKHRDTSKNSMYGVESLETTISSLGPALDCDDQEEEEIKLRRARRNFKNNLKQPNSRPSEEDVTDCSSPSFKSSASISRNASPSHQRRPSQASISRPYTPLSFNSPAPESLLSSPDSRRASDAGSYMDDTRSQAIVSSGDEDKEMGPPQLMDNGSAPQLIMPSIKMPSRRPFTEKGKNMGRLKVLIAGDSGVGKTSLIKAIVQSCEDIVHVDPISAIPVSTAQSSWKNSKSKSRHGSSDLTATSQITEIYASTRTYPAWWSDLEESQILRRRKSIGDSVLERNLCFVDTPGYGSSTSCMECITPVIDYIESHLRKATSLENMTESEIIGMLGGNGGSQVDLALYVIKHQIKPVDIEYLRRLSEVTNVIPVIAQAEHMSPDQLSLVKEKVVSALHEASIKSFSFTTSQKGGQSQVLAPYSISTSPSKDHENMDASVLMSPDYVSPLMPSELHILVSQIFEPSTISWLRHSAAKKFIQWRDSSTALVRPQSLYQPLRTPSAFSSYTLTAPVGTTTSYTLARITDHTQREERIAQVRLANWAADLQRSLQNERARFENLARSERAVWLTERLEECVQDETALPLLEARKRNDPYAGVLVRQGSRNHSPPRTQKPIPRIDRQDPLGLLELNAEMKRKGWVVVKLLGGVGIISGLALLVVKTWQGTEGDVQIWGLRLKDWAELGLCDAR